MKAGDGPFEEHVGQYETWFSDNQNDYQTKLRGVNERILPAEHGVEIGVGTGRFAAPLGIPLGLGPSLPMLRVARGRGIEMVIGVGESLPLPDFSFDLRKLLPFLLGVVIGGPRVGFEPDLLDTAPEERRTVCVEIDGTFNSSMVVLSGLAGVFFDLLGFVGTLGMTVPAMILASSILAEKEEPTTSIPT